MVENKCVAMCMKTHKDVNNNLTTFVNPYVAVLQLFGIWSDIFYCVKELDKGCMRLLVSYHVDGEKMRIIINAFIIS